jgi:hypothetical protein
MSAAKKSRSVAQELRILVAGLAVGVVLWIALDLFWGAQVGSPRA